MKNRGNMIFAMVLALIVIAAIALMVVFSQKDDVSPSNDSTAATNANVKTSDDYKKIDTKGQPVLGDKEAPVTLVEFGDFKCPACKYFDMDIQPKLVKKYVDKGDLKMYFINTPFHGGESITGANAAEYVLANEPDKYWDFHNAMFAAQPNTKTSTEDKWLTIGKVKSVAQEAGVKDIDGLIKATKDSSEQKKVNKDIKLFQTYQINETPTIIINGKKISNQLDIKQLEKEIEAAKK